MKYSVYLTISFCLLLTFLPSVYGDKHKLEIKARTGEGGQLSSLGYAFVNMETAPKRKNFSTGQKVRQAIEAQRFPSLAGKSWTIHDNANKLVENHTEVYITPATSNGVPNYMTVDIDED
ncbi:hypothetical protein DdX_10816 [Ditylenchus destructor]|uniref:Uncharacterized protein n=1 Tax=Ditylenchus destructor TaxID=166010 RepID=A0AAD4R548_9BILA|nr:hypothetical protein DdX_10816 [Ditylenchus destructor]